MAARSRRIADLPSKRLILERLMHLEKPVVTMHRHVPPKKSRQVAKPVVVHLGIAVTLVVDLPDVDVGDRLTIAHHCILFVVLSALKYCHA